MRMPKDNRRCIIIAYALIAHMHVHACINVVMLQFQAVWDPKASDIFVCGSMQKGPHGIDMFSASAAASSKSAQLLRLSGGDVMTSIQSLCVFHPRLPILAGINSSGRCHIFR